MLNPAKNLVKNAIIAVFSLLRNEVAVYRLAKSVRQLQVENSQMYRQIERLEELAKTTGLNERAANAALDALGQATKVFRESNDVKIVINRWIIAYCKHLNTQYDNTNLCPVLEKHEKQRAIRDFLAKNAQWFDACDVSYIKEQTGYDEYYDDCIVATA